MFRSALERGGRLGAGPVIRAWRGLLVFASRWFQIESLYRFNAKFQPEWLPRYVVYPGAGDLPRIAIAALEAEAFIVWPHPRIVQLAAADAAWPGGMTVSTPLRVPGPQPRGFADFGRCRVIGVVNVTPDSFSDGGEWFDAGGRDRARTRAGRGRRRLVDVGGESTRPGAQRVDVAEELRRVIPVVAPLAAAGVAVSIDTMHAEVAAPRG